MFLLAATLMSAAAARHACAQDDVFSVTEIAVDVTAQTVTAAREQAINEAQIRGFAMLIKKLVPEAEHARVPLPGAREINRLVRNFEIDRERASSARYIATLRVKFDADAVRGVLRASLVPFAETISNPVLVLPVLRREGALMLWDDANPWRDAWRTLPARAGLVPFIVPLGDIADAGAVSAEDAAKGDMAKLAPFARRNGADDVLVAIAEPGAGAALDITITRLSTVSQERTWVRNLAPTRPFETAPQLMAAAAAAIAHEIEEAWKKDNVLRFDAPREIVARVPLGGLADWANLRKRLDGIALIERSDTISVMRSGAMLRLRFLGDEEQLKMALAQRVLTLTEHDGTWLIRLGGPTPTRPAARGAATNGPSDGPRDSPRDPERQ